MRINNKIRRKLRGVSPVIATVLLIGLTVVAGVAAAGVHSLPLQQRQSVKSTRMQ